MSANDPIRVDRSISVFNRCKCFVQPIHSIVFPLQFDVIFTLCSIKFSYSGKLCLLTYVAFTLIVLAAKETLAHCFDMQMSSVHLSVSFVLKLFSTKRKPSSKWTSATLKKRNSNANTLCSSMLRSWNDKYSLLSATFEWNYTHLIGKQYLIYYLQCQSNCNPSLWHFSSHVHRYSLYRKEISFTNVYTRTSFITWRSMWIHHFVPSSWFYL